MSQIELHNVNKYFGDNHVLKDISLVIEDGDFMTLLGPSGCGKTTTLRVIAGLENPEGGIVTIGGREVVNAAQGLYTPPADRDLSLVFQSYALWPHMTVFDNVAFGLTINKTPRNQIRPRVEAALEKLQMGPYIERYPSELSGGQQQRVSIARAIVTEPEILLLDEPLSNLDAKLRLEMRSELQRLHNELQTTIVYVTHDQVEALTLSTKIAVFFEGVLAQVDKPINIYRYPADLQVTDFVGNPRINLVHATGTYSNGKLVVDSSVGKFPLVTDYNRSGDVLLAIYPEDIKIADGEQSDAIETTVYSILPAGSETLVQLRVNDDEVLMVKSLGLMTYSLGETVWIKIDPTKINAYDKKTGTLVVKQSGEQEAAAS